MRKDWRRERQGRCRKTVDEKEEEEEERGTLI